ncbi:unnamed protein product, partial [marine sediment metagenome]
GCWDGPVPLKGTDVCGGWSLRRFLEDHTGHKTGLMNNTDVNVERKRVLVEDWGKIIPVTKWCMQFKIMDDLFDEVHKDFTVLTIYPPIELGRH